MAKSDLRWPDARIFELRYWDGTYREAVAQRSPASWRSRARWVTRRPQPQTLKGFHNGGGHPRRPL